MSHEPFGGWGAPSESIQQIATVVANHLVAVIRKASMTEHAAARVGQEVTTALAVDSRPGLFRGFANVWTPVALASALKPNQTLPVKVAGERLVLFRDGNGAASALIDVCPHRGVALSLGKVKDGCVECPFHGWKFNGQGEATHVPWNPDAKLKNLSATKVQTREIGHMVWVYTSVSSTEVPEPVVAEELLRPDVAMTGQIIRWKTHWTRAMENMLDYPHLPFIHAGTIGRGMLSAPHSKMDITWSDTAFGASTTIAIDGKAQPGGLDYFFPNAMRLFIPIPNKLMRMVAYCIPIDDEYTDMLFLNLRDFLKPHLFDFIFNIMNRRIGGEDQAVLESSYPSKVPAPSMEKSVRTDAPTLAFRARYRRELDR